MHQVQFNFNSKCSVLVFEKTDFYEKDLMQIEEFFFICTESYFEQKMITGEHEK